MGPIKDAAKKLNGGFDDAQVVAEKSARPSEAPSSPPENSSRSSLKRGWLTIVSQLETNREAEVRCPYRPGMTSVHDCFECDDYASLAIDSAGHRSFVVCARAERDGVAATSESVVPGEPEEGEL